ncbi:MAG: PQQ-like beta-propeller repeat protein [Anaerolineales bacterium]|nr:PQQ-like beta-propeller repeat protein [Anaerolineales bacterium]
MHRSSRLIARAALAVCVYAAGSAADSLSQTTETLYLPSIHRTFYAGYGQTDGVWTQEGGNPQRTGYTPIEPKTPWTLLWTWNASDANGGATCPTGSPEDGHCYNANKQPNAVAGGGLIFAPAGAQGLYGIFDRTGQMAWHVTGATFYASPAYADGFVYAGSADGRLFKVDAQSGQTQTYNAGSPINRGILAVGGYVYALTESGDLHKVDAATLTAAWVYDSGATAVWGTGLAYAASRAAVIFGGDDLNVHAVNAADGTRKWRVKPTPNTPGFPNQFMFNWPVVAEVNGLVLVRMRLAHPDGLWNFPRVQNNAEARTYLTNNPGMQNVFALDLDDGVKSFIPAIGFSGPEYQSTEPLALPTCGSSTSCAYLMVGPAPVVKVMPDGSEVAYVPFRSQQGNPNDARWDAHMGEMVLNSATVPGLVAGDLRFVLMGRRDSYVYIADELADISMAGNTLFHAHWGANETIQITDRSNSRGLTDANPIQTIKLPTVMRRIQACGGAPNLVTHYTTCGMLQFGDTRYWSPPGYWMYWNTSPSSSSGIVGDRMRKGYTFVTNDLIIIQGFSGELMAFKHSGP